MKRHETRALSLVVTGALLLFTGLAMAQDIPLKDWPVPGTLHGGRTALVDIGKPGVFNAMTPCRLADTRRGGYPAAIHPPPLAAVRY